MRKMLCCQRNYPPYRSRDSKISSAVSIALLLVVLCHYAAYENFLKITSTTTTKWWMYSDLKEMHADKSWKASERKNRSAFWDQVPKSRKQAIHDRSEQKLILFDYPPFGEEKEYPINDKATCGRCKVSYDTSKRREADVVVYHLSGIRRRGVEARSFPGQIYVWMNQESPWTTLYYYKVTLDDNDDQFNLTMTYRRDSDIQFPYFTIKKIVKEISSENESKSFKHFLSRKRKLAISVTGNCGFTKGAFQRMRMLLSLLDAGLEVDVFGACALRSLEGSWESLPEQVDGYKFFLSFENAFHCRDYITEKTWWNALRSGVVPVIWGPTRQDVEAVLPENSFLFVEDFDTPQALVDRLRYFDDHVVEYVKFFAWRKKLDSRIFDRAPQTEMVGFCQLCRMLHDDDNYEKEHGVKPVRMVPSIYNWWYKGESGLCLMPRSYSEIFLGCFQRDLLLGELYFGLLTWKRFYVTATVVLIIVVLIRQFNSTRR